ncbi:MAG TPA: di-heme oxidoredictase family protein, partial [Polyangiaceae bacterium]|nr:di-heme oxidoredictase family protein [Polyangiaceae bacterium]
MKARSSLSAGMMLGISLLQLNCGSNQGGLPAMGAGASGPTGSGANGPVAGPNGGGAASAGAATGSGAGAGTAAGADATGTGGATSTALPGVCPDGFVACSGVCLETSLIGKDCRPLSCDTIEGAMPLSRSTVTARGYEWNVDLAGDTTTVTFKPGAAGGGLEATIAADITYRVNGDPALHTATMTDSGSGSFSFNTHDLKAGDDLEFFFHQTVAPQKIILPGPGGKPLIDTMWFHQVVGMPHSGEPSYPLTVKLAGRFRDRHPNEERYDHYVDTYFAGPTFDLTFVDHGDALDVTIKPQAMMDVQAVDFKNYECFGSGQYGALPAPAPLCGTPPALAAVGVRAKAVGDGTFTTRVEHLAYGQLVDFELTFVRSRTYYTEWFQYFVGSGRFQPKEQHPWAHAAGEQSVSNVTVDEFGYAQHVPNITPEELANFISGKVLFEADFDSHVGYNPPTTYDCPRGLMPGANVPTIVTPPPASPLFTAGNSYSNTGLSSIARAGYTSASCFSCHHLDGKGHPPDDKGMGDTLVKLFSDDGSPDAIYGTILDSHAAGGGAPEAQPKVTWQTMAGTFMDGTPYELRKPVLAMDGLRDGALGATTHASLRIPRPVFGLGLIEAVAPETILARADADDANKDGISGRPNFIKDPATGQQVLGRFGWKAATASLREQAALAFVNDIGITSPLFPEH